MKLHALSYPKLQPQDVDSKLRYMLGMKELMIKQKAEEAAK